METYNLGRNNMEQNPPPPQKNKKSMVKTCEEKNAPFFILDLGGGEV